MHRFFSLAVASYLAVSELVEFNVLRANRVVGRTLYTVICWMLGSDPIGLVVPLGKSVFNVSTLFQ